MSEIIGVQARQILDCLVGFTISPILWANISRKSGLSAGRCQTPALRLIYDNQQEINKILRDFNIPLLDDLGNPLKE